jgi:pimeloyl-ACP methyl ester carboxylesterase
MKTEIIRRDGLDLVLHVEECEGPIVFFQHGLCGDAAQPAAVFPCDSGARLAVLSCRGHGASEAGAPEGFSIATFAADVAAAIETLSPSPCVVGGISMGSAIAMRLAVLLPDLVSGLVIARPAWLTEAAPVNMRPNLMVGEMLMNEPAPGELDAFLSSETARALAEQAPDNLASLTGFFRRTPRAVTAELLTRISRDGPGITEEQLRALRVPTLVIGHEQDVVHPLAFARHLAHLIPGARFLEIPPKARGLAPYETAFRAGLGQFLQEIFHAPSRNHMV